MHTQLKYAGHPELRLRRGRAMSKLTPSLRTIALLGRLGLPWLSLLAVSASLAYAMNGAVVRGVPAINLATADATNAVRREESDAFRYADRSVLPTSGNLVGDSDSDSCGRGQDVVVTITYRDTSTGRDLQMRCVSTSDRLGRNDLVVSAESMRDISAFLSALCDPE